MEDTDEELMQEMQNGNEEAISGLYDRYSGKIYRMALAMTRNSALAEDVVSEVFWRVHNYRHKFRPTVSFKAWLYRIARNVIFSFSEKQKPFPLQPDWIASSSDPVHEVEQEQFFDMVRDELHRLPQEDQHLLSLYAFEGLSYSAISKMMGISIPALKSRFHRIRAKLREALKKRGEWNEL